MEIISDDIRIYRDRIRIFFILYFFSESYNDHQFPTLKRVFKTEVKLQKLDFLLRNPDYFAYELLVIAQKNETIKEEIKGIIKNIFNTREPVLRKLEMERFLFGAWEDMDDVIAFLDAFGLIRFDSNKDSRLYIIDKQYFITEFALEKVSKREGDWGELSWYMERCRLIKKYFGHLSGSQLKAMQYEIDEYANASYNDYIQSIADKVKEMFYNTYYESL